MASRRSEQLPAADRRAVFLAVRRGERIEDSRLRPAAVSMAADLLRSMNRWDFFHRHRRWVIGFLAAGAVLAGGMLVAGDHSLLRVMNLVVSLLLLAVFLTLDPVFDRLRRNAGVAAESNRDPGAESST